MAERRSNKMCTFRRFLIRSVTCSGAKLLIVEQKWNDSDGRSLSEKLCLAIARNGVAAAAVAEGRRGKNDDTE